MNRIKKNWLYSFCKNNQFKPKKEGVFFSLFVVIQRLFTAWTRLYVQAINMIKKALHANMLYYDNVSSVWPSFFDNAVRYYTLISVSDYVNY